jgi:outer membrane protein assembly factor BamC
VSALKSFKLSAVLGTALLVSACSLFPDRDNEYKQVKSTPRTQLPGGEQPEFIDLYPIPTTEQIAAGELIDEVPRPEPLSLTDDKDGVQLRKLDDQRWIVIAQPPNQVWPLVRQFWDLYRIAVVYEQPTDGVLETRWLKRNDARQPLMDKIKGRVHLGDDLLDKYYVSVEQGIRRGLTEVHLVQRQVGLYDSISAPVVFAPKQPWPNQSENLALEAAVLDELMTFLAKQTVSGQSTSFLAEGLVGKSRVSLINTGEEGSDNENVALRVESKFDRAWASVVNSMDEKILKLKDRNRSEGTIFVTYNPRAKEEEPGFFSQLFGADPISESDQSINIKVEQVDEYFVHVLATDEEGQVLAKDENLKVLEFIQSRLF